MPKLSPEVIAFITEGAPLDITTSPKWATYGAATRAAILLAQGGIRVFPCDEVSRCRAGTCAEARRPKNGGECPSPGKHPRIGRGVNAATTNQGQLVEWADRWPNTNWGQALDGRIVVDIDVAEGKQGVQQWDEVRAKHTIQADDLETLTYRTGRGGTQLFFLLPAGVKADSLPDKLRDHIDLKRGAGLYVMVEGSVTDAPYTIINDVPERVAPGWLVTEAKAWRTKKRTEKTKAAKAAGSPSGKGLSAELALPDDDPSKGNVWMTGVAGYFAAGLRREEDLHAILNLINATRLTEPMSEGELLKITRSVIERELRNHHGTKDGIDPNADALHEARNGYLALTGDRHSLVVLNDQGQGDAVVTTADTYLDCGLVPRYVIDVGDDRYYDIEVFGPNHKGGKHTLVRGETLVDAKKRDAWLAGLGYVVSPPFHATYELADKARMMRYIEAQNPPRGKATECLGWHGTDFLTPEGILRDGKTEPFDGLVPKPQAVEQSMASYGNRIGREELRDFLREVWTFQEPEVASVAMAWWVMCLLKGTYKSSIAPILYVDAPSGSGKTSGFFAFLVALAGNTSGSGSITVPRVRHQLASNRNGVVWVDDMSDLRSLAEVLRQAASKGTHTKTDTGDNRTTISQHMVGNVLLSCEGLGRTLDEKAMRDRVIHIKMKSVKGRQSLKGDRPQWFDILDLLTRYDADTDDYAPIAHKMAGTAVSLLSEYATVRLESYMERADGRHAEKHAILRAGAEILADVLGFDDPIRHVAGWISRDEDKGGENLFLSHLAWRVWDELGQPDSQIIDRYGSKRPAAVFVDADGSMYVNPEMCSSVIANIRDLDARDRQLGTRDAIISELQETGHVARQCRVVRRVNGAQVSYWKLSALYSARAAGRVAPVQQSQSVIESSL